MEMNLLQFPSCSFFLYFGFANVELRMSTIVLFELKYIKSLFLLEKYSPFKSFLLERIPRSSRSSICRDIF